MTRLSRPSLLTALTAASSLAPPLLLSAAVVAAPPLAASHGVYVDGSGTQHAWKINASHTLLWEEKPFVPVGGIFRAQSWSKGATDANFAADKAALDRLKAGGVTDVIVRPARGGITDVPAASLQRLLDYLDAAGFTYGISLNDGPREPLAAYEIRPGAYRQSAPGGGGALRFPVDDLLSALYFVITPDGKDVVASGDAEPVAEGARVNTPAVGGQMITYLFPEKAYLPGGPLGLPNLWEGYDDYRDSLLALFGKVHPGKGLRFFVDALPPDLALSDESLRSIPDSSGFAAEWAAYLSDRYKSMTALEDAWGLTERGEIADFATAAHLLPLWSGGKGIAFYYDRVAHKRFGAEAARSTFWSDYHAFLTTSVRGYMNGLATALKRGIADVPVVYESHGWSPLFTRLRAGDGGFDGIGIVAYGRGRDLVNYSAGEVYAQASEAQKTLWLPVTSVDDAAPAPPPAGSGAGAGAAEATGYATRADLHAAFDELSGIGARGFFLNELPRSADVAGPAVPPDPLGWLAEYRRMLTAAGAHPGGADTLTTLPGVTYYPRNLGAGTVRLLSNGEWWLPTDRTGTLYDFGPTIRAYGLADSDGGDTYYFWDPQGAQRTIRIKLPPQSTKLKDAQAPRVSWSASANGVAKNGVLTLTIGPDPIRLMNFPTVPLPMDAFDEAYKQAQRMAEELHRRKVLEAGKDILLLPQIRMTYTHTDPWQGYARLHDLMEEMRGRLRAYAWLEAEGSPDYPYTLAFDAVEERAGASGGRVLVVGRRGAGMPLATATYSITVSAPGAFQLWVAASPNAPLTFRLDGQSLLDDGNVIGRAPNTPGATYANGSLVWTHLGAVNLPKGTHQLEMRASGPATVDTILLYKGDFTPSGITPPPVLGE